MPDLDRTKRLIQRKRIGKKPRPQFSVKPAQPPSRMGCTLEEWRVKKRLEARAIVRACELYQWGSAYTPRGAGDVSYQIHRLAERLMDELEGDWTVAL
jgi:hypothetical protein